MQRKFKLGALAWGIAVLTAFPADASASSNAAVCNLVATGSTYAAQCWQGNVSTTSQTATATAGNGGTATGGNSGPVQVVGDGAQGASYGGNAYANGGNAQAHNSAVNNQSNRISGDGQGLNTATTSQTATATGGNGGTAVGGNGGPVQVVGNWAYGASYGGDAYANGGNGEARNSVVNNQSNWFSGHGLNTANSSQTATATGGNGGIAIAGNGGPVQVVGDGAQGASRGGDAHANGGGAKAHNSVVNSQSNKTRRAKKAKKPRRRAK